MAIATIFSRLMIWIANKAEELKLIGVLTVALFAIVVLSVLYLTGGSSDD